AKGLILAEQLLSRGAVGMLDLDRLVNLTGVVVDGLATQLMPLGLPCDGAVATGETRRGVGDPEEHGYLAHGDRTPWVRDCVVTNPTLGAHPHSNQEAPGKTLPSANSK